MHHFIYFLLCCVTISLHSQSIDQTFLVDFGPNNEVDGNVTENPDGNSNYWTNVTNPVATSIKIKLLSTESQESDYAISVSSALSKNGINHGGLLNPDAEILGPYGIATATQDYFFTASQGGIVIRNLNPEKAYRFKFFASRNNAETRVSEYVVDGANTQMLTLQSSGEGIGTSGSNGNEDVLVESDFIFPDFEGSISIDISVAEGSFAYLNLMEITEYSGVSLVKVEGISIEGEDITVNGGSSQLKANIAPSDATVQDVLWTIDNQDLCSISRDGLLVARSNGQIQVSATSLESGSTVQVSRDLTFTNQDIVNYYVDLGPGDGISGNVTEVNQNDVTWNNITDPKAEAAEVLLKSSMGASEIRATISQSLLGNGLDAGGLEEVDPFLGSLGILSAVEDYFSTQNSGALVFSGLNPENGYRFDLFGSRVSSESRKTRYILQGLNTSTGVLETSNNTSSFYTSDIIFPDENNEIQLSISVAGGQFAYLNAMRIVEYQNVDICPNRNKRGIAVMGSSVARGQGAPNDMGYASQYTELLGERAASGEGSDWDVTNISVGGDNTVKLLNRWTEDLIPLCGSYVLYGLSLGNEGIANSGQTAFDRYEENMLKLIDQAEEAGLQPIVANNYTREDFGTVEYNYIKQMNLLMHQWDVPSINLLGAIDNGFGNWATGYQQDFGHPNLAGHQEFFYAMVPSLFDALEAGKPLPKKQDISLLEIGPGTNRFLEWVPENTLHSFTIDFNMMVDGAAEILRFEQETGLHSLTIDENMKLVYNSGNGETIASQAAISSLDTLSVTLTHYYAWGKTIVYLDGSPVGEPINENLEVESFVFGSETDLTSFKIGDVLLYRSGMNETEIAALTAEQLLKSSLEIYSPLVSESSDLLRNYAQSLNSLELGFYSSIKEENIATNEIHLFPNPTREILSFSNHEEARLSQYTIYNSMGEKILEGKETTLDVSRLSKGNYYLKATFTEGIRYGRFLKL